jgi:hypothetical protein
MMRLPNRSERRCEKKIGSGVGQMGSLSEESVVEVLGFSGRVGRLAEMWKEAATLSRNCPNAMKMLLQPTSSAETLPGTLSALAL